LVSEAFELTGQSEILKEFERPQMTNEDGSIVHIKFKSS
jgi:hypothetical protein